MHRDFCFKKLFICHSDMHFTLSMLFIHYEVVSVFVTLIHCTLSLISYFLLYYSGVPLNDPEVTNDAEMTIACATTKCLSQVHHNVSLLLLMQWNQTAASQKMKLHHVSLIKIYIIIFVSSHLQENCSVVII